MPDAPDPSAHNCFSATASFRTPFLTGHLREMSSSHTARRFTNAASWRVKGCLRDVHGDVTIGQGVLKLRLTLDALVVDMMLKSDGGGLEFRGGTIRLDRRSSSQSKCLATFTHTAMVNPIRKVDLHCVEEECLRLRMISLNCISTMYCNKRC